MQIDLKPSKSFICLGLLILAGSMLTVLWLPLPFYQQGLFSIVIAGYGAYIGWQEICLRGKRSVVSLRYCDDNSWRLRDRSGANADAVLCPGTVVTAFYCSLRFKSHHWRSQRTYIIWRDALTACGYRQLLMTLYSLKIKED